MVLVPPDIPLPSLKLFNYFSVEIRTLLRYYAAYSGNSLLTFRKNLSVPSSRVFLKFLTPEMEPIGYPNTSVRNCYYTLCNKLEECRSHLLRVRSLQSRVFLGW